MTASGSSPSQTSEQGRPIVCRFSRTARHPGASRRTSRSSLVSPSPMGLFGKIQLGTGFGKRLDRGGVWSLSSPMLSRWTFLIGKEPLPATLKSERSSLNGAHRAILHFAANMACRRST